MIEFLHDLVTPLLDKEIAGTIYMAAGIIFTFWYVPQIIRLMKDTTGAAALSLNTMFFQLLLRLPGLMFFALTMEVVPFWVVALDMFSRTVVLILAVQKRMAFHKEMLGDSSFFNALGAVDLSKEVLENEKQHHSSKMSKSMGHEVLPLKDSMDKD